MWIMNYGIPEGMFIYRFIVMQVFRYISLDTYDLGRMQTNDFWGDKVRCKFSWYLTAKGIYELGYAYYNWLSFHHDIIDRFKILVTIIITIMVFISIINIILMPVLLLSLTLLSLLIINFDRYQYYSYWCCYCHIIIAIDIIILIIDISCNDC